MRFPRALQASCLLFLLWGCNEMDPGLERERAVNSWMVRTLATNAVENAILSQHTLYLYHFVPGARNLNELGYSDLSVLAGHYRQAEGVLNVWKGDIPDALYAARVDEVKGLLARLGVEASRVSIEDGIGGGDGAPSERVKWSLDKERKSGPLTTAREGSTSSAPSTKPASMTGVSR